MNNSWYGILLKVTSLVVVWGRNVRPGAPGLDMVRTHLSQTLLDSKTLETAYIVETAGA